MYLALDYKLVVVQVTVVRCHTIIIAHVLAAQTLFLSHKRFVELLAVAGADDVRAGIAEELLHRLRQIADGGGIRLLNEEIAGVGMLEGEHDQIHSLVEVHEEASHVGIGDGDVVSRLDLVDEQRNDAAAAAHDVAVAGAADGGTAALGSHAGIGVYDVLHHGLGNTHGVDGIRRLVGRQADYTLNTSFNSCVQHVVGTDDIGLHRLHGKELAGRNLFQCSSVEDVVHTRHGVADGLWVADVADVEFDLFGMLWMLRLKLVTHIILLLLIAGEDANPLQVRVQKML